MEGVRPGPRRKIVLKWNIISVTGTRKHKTQINAKYVRNRNVVV